MSTLYIDRKNVRLDLDSDALVFFENGERIGTIPLAPLQRIIVRGNVTVDTSLLGKLGAHGIGMIVLSGRRAEPSLFLPRPHNDAARRLAQYRAATDPGACLPIARSIVQGKLQAQHELLQARLDARPDARYELTRSTRGIAGMLAQIERQADLAALRGLEGAAANLYFAAFAALVPPSLGFHGRNRQPPRDPVNALLSLAYTLLHGESVLAAHAAGLDPAIGFFHQPSFGRESLACDLVEAHRAEVDAWVLQLFGKQTLRNDNFSTTGEGCLLGKAGRSVFYKAWEPVAEHIRRALDRQLRCILHRLMPEISAEEEVGFDDSPRLASTIHPAAAQT
jgi:CRISPR-associated protein Cas1